jgi:hypothetical protein
MAGSTIRDTASGSDPSRSPPGLVRLGRLVTGLALTAVISAGVWLVLDARRPAAGRTAGVRLLTLERAFPDGGRYPSDPYIGPDVCAGCHPGESALHARSGHSRTLRSAGRRSLSRQLDGTSVADPEHDDVLWGYRYRDGQLHISRTAEGRVEEFIAEYAFGSGQHATTFATVIHPGIPKILEHRLTYFAGEHAMGLTPGHGSRARLPGVTQRGGVLLGDDARKCFGCHTTQTSARPDRAIDDETMIPNVSCERCHGPGRAHVEAARRGASEDQLGLPLGPGRFAADDLLKVCGACHRHPSRLDSGPIVPDDARLARFQPVGLLQSRCFRESGGRLSCVTCHDPHARASTDRASYLAVCLSCHAGPGGGPATQPADAGGQDGGARSVVAAPCPVQPRGDCINCHMPRVDAGQHVLFADHWIRVPSSERPGPRAAAPRFRPVDVPEP